MPTMFNGQISDIFAMLNEMPDLKPVTMKEAALVYGDTFGNSAVVMKPKLTLAPGLLPKHFASFALRLSWNAKATIIAKSCTTLTNVE